MTGNASPPSAPAGQGSNQPTVTPAHKAGHGNWAGFKAAGLNLKTIMDIAEHDWGARLRGVDKPWLCWNVDDEWSLVQQKLVRSAGWTPVVGFDPRVGRPKDILPEAILIDFNEHLGLPLLYPHFPLEFAFLFCDRLAFWHSDLVIRREKMDRLAEMFANLKDGETAATWVFPGWRSIFKLNERRYWELVGCTTRGASRDQFEKGAGWWRGIWEHPSSVDPADIERKKRKSHWEHGAGIYYWERNFGGKVVVIKGAEYEEGHCSKINNKKYVTQMPLSLHGIRSKQWELRHNFSLHVVCEKLGLQDALTPPRDS